MAGVWGGGAWVNPPTTHCKGWCLGGGGVSWLVGFFTKLYSNTMEKAFNAFPCFCGLFCGLHFFRLHFHAIYCSRSLLVSALSTAFTRFLLFPVEIPHFFLLFNIVLSYMYIHTYMLAWARVSFICRWWLGWRWFSWPYFRFVVVHSRFYGFSRPSPYNLPPTFGEMGESSSRIICKNHGNNR